MRKWIVLIAIFTSLASHATDGTARSDGYSPAYQQCITATDKSCPGMGAAVVAIQIPLPEKRDKTFPVDETTIFGRCEMQVVGETEPRPCEGVRLVARADQEGEVRTAVIEGYNFKIENLKQNTYNLDATHANYDLVTDTKRLIRGRSVQIKVKALPRL